MLELKYICLNLYGTFFAQFLEGFPGPNDGKLIAKEELWSGVCKYSEIDGFNFIVIISKKKKVYLVGEFFPALPIIGFW